MNGQYLLLKEKTHPRPSHVLHVHQGLTLLIQYNQWRYDIEKNKNFHLCTYYLRQNDYHQRNSEKSLNYATGV